MNPLGGLIILLGLLVVIVGVKGTQHQVVTALQEARPSGKGWPPVPNIYRPLPPPGGQKQLV